MASTYSPTLRTELPATGDLMDAWAPVVNNNLDVPIEDGLSGVAVVNVPDANVVLTTANALADQARMPVLVFTGALTATRIITAPNVPKVYILRNNTTGGQNLLLRAGSVAPPVSAAGYPIEFGAVPYSGSSIGTVPTPGVIIPPNSTVYAFTDGTTFDYCVNSLPPNVAADSIVPPAPLGISNGGTDANSAVGAQGTLGIGSAGLLNADSGASASTVVQRDGFSNFSAGTIFAGLQGVAATSTNTSLLGGISPAGYVPIDSNSRFLTLSFSAGNPNDVDLYGLYGAGVYLIWWQSLLSVGANRFAMVYAIPDPVTISLNNDGLPSHTVNSGRSIKMTASGVPSPGATAGVMFGFVKVSDHQ